MKIEALKPDEPVVRIELTATELRVLANTMGMTCRNEREDDEDFREGDEAVFQHLYSGISDNADRFGGNG